MKHICENCLTIIYKSKVTPTVCPHCESGKMFDIGDSIADHILNLELELDRLQQASRWIPIDYVNRQEAYPCEIRYDKNELPTFWRPYLPTPPEGE